MRTVWRIERIARAISAAIELAGVLLLEVIRLTGTTPGEVARDLLARLPSSAADAAGEAAS